MHPALRTDDLGDMLEASRELARRSVAFDDDGADPAALCEPLTRRGLFAAVLPVDEGGRGWATDPQRAPSLLRALLALGSANLSAGRLFEGHVNAIKLVFRYGSEEQRRDLARDIGAGAVAGVWNAEAPPGLRLESVPGPGGLAVLAGEKIYCSGLGLVSRPLVSARTGDGEVFMIAPRRLDGVSLDLSRWTVHGMRATATGTVDFTGSAVFPEDVIGSAGDYYRSPLFKGGAWRFAAVHAGAVARLAQLTRRELRQRGREADPHQKARLGALAIAAETAELWVTRASAAAEGGELPQDAVDAYVGLARTAVERAAVEAMATVQRTLGLSALTRPNPVERIVRDLATYLRQPFPDAALDEAAGYLSSCPGGPPWSSTPEVDS